MYAHEQTQRFRLTENANQKRESRQGGRGAPPIGATRRGETNRNISDRHRRPKNRQDKRRQFRQRRRRTGRGSGKTQDANLIRRMVCVTLPHMAELMDRRRRLPQKEQRDQKRQQEGRRRKTTHVERTGGKAGNGIFYYPPDKIGHGVKCSPSRKTSTESPHEHFSGSGAGCPARPR